MKVYETGDSGPSGHGFVTRGHVDSLLDEDVDLTFRTHQWGWNTEGFLLDRPHVDSRFKNKIVTSDRFNEEYLASSQEEATSRADDLTDFLGTNTTCRSRDCPIRDFDGDEDVWHAIAGMEWVPMAPTRDPDIATVMETDYNLTEVPGQWTTWAKECNEVWVPNQWVYDAFDEAGHTDNVEIVPYGIDFSYKPTDYDCTSCSANKHTQPYGGGACLDDDSFTFFCVARWYHIKGLDRLLEAFVREFSDNEDVRLFLKTTSNNQFGLNGNGVNKAVQQFIKELDVRDVPEIGIRTKMMGDQQLMDLYGLADAFAFPSRAECVGISWAQAMHAGTPVVTNNFSAMEEYISDDEAILINDGVTEEPQSHVDWLPRKGGDWYPDGAEWFDPDVDAVRRALRRAYEMDDGKRADMTAKARDMVHETFDWSDHIETRVERFEQLAE